MKEIWCRGKPLGRKFPDFGFPAQKIAMYGPKLQKIEKIADNGNFWAKTPENPEMCVPERLPLLRPKNQEKISIKKKLFKKLSFEKG